MAGDWIKIEHATPDKPEIVAISTALGIDQNAVIGACLRLWIWADQQSETGNALSVTLSWLDAHCCCAGIATQLREVGWLTGEDGSVSIAKFDRHLGKSAKTRSQTARRVRKSRESCNASVTQRPLPEKRREEKRIIKKGRVSTVDASMVKDRLGEDSEFAKSPQFIAAFTDWISHRQQIKKTVTPLSAAKALNRFVAWGVDRSIRAIEHSIRQGWTGIYEEVGNAANSDQSDQDMMNKVKRSVWPDDDDNKPGGTQQ